MNETCNLLPFITINMLQEKLQGHVLFLTPFFHVFLNVTSDTNTLPPEAFSDFLLACLYNELCSFETSVTETSTN